ncbi:MAG TPA: peptidase T [Flavitalea sp.]|nr:peptidase T [Flavitalea sp.]
MFGNYKFTVEEKFLEYVQIDTQSDPDSLSQPSTEKQKDLSRLLVSQLHAMGVTNAHLDEYGYVYATLAANTIKKVPVICFCAHVDTAPDCSGTGVRPMVHRNYNAKDIILPDDPSQVITTNEYPYLFEKVGEDIITASGKTLLGADDKAGVAVIMDMVNFLVTNPSVKHGTVRILFTPDEEIGRGVDKVSIQKLGADFGYTLDGGERGTVEDETFSADGVTVVIEGVSAHPGYAKDKLVNAIKIAAALLESLPRDFLSPETTSGRDGFIHPVQIDGIAEKVTIKFIVRDFITGRLAEYEDLIRHCLQKVISGYPGAKADVVIREQYRNMKEVLDNYPHVSQYAKEAIQRAGEKPISMSARGGTDGSRLSFMGLPCPNLFTGEMAFHGKHEFISVQDMQKSVETIVHLLCIWEENS